MMQRKSATTYRSGIYPQISKILQIFVQPSTTTHLRLGSAARKEDGAPDTLIIILLD
jgi:hypothetical protein